MTYFKQKRVRPDFRGTCFLLPLLPARFCPWGSTAMTVIQTAAHDRIGRDGTGGREAQSRWSGPELAEETKSDPAGASGAPRGDVDLEKYLLVRAGRGGGQVTAQNQGAVGGGAGGGSAPARTRRTNDTAKSTGTGQITATARTRPGTQGGGDTGCFFKNRANRGLHQSRQEPGCLKVIHRTTRRVRLPCSI